MTAPSNAPTREIGYAQISFASSGTSNSNWWAFDDETTPELRWPQSVYVYDQMRRTDAQVASVLRAVSLPVRRTPWRIDPAGARAEVVQLVAEDLGLPIVGQDPKPLPRARDRFSWLEHLREALLMLPFGHAYFEQNVRIVEGKARLRKLAARMPKTIEEIEVARDGGLVSIKQYSVDSVAQPVIPVSRLVAYILDREAGNWLGSSILRPAYKHWMIKDRLLRVQAQTIERNGMGIPVYEAAETEKSTDAGLGLATSLRAGEAAGAALPFGAKLRLMGVEGQLPDAEPAIRYHDEQIARAVLAHFLNLGTQTGSWALGTTFADFFTLSLQTLAQQVADVATQHVVEDLVDWNWGEDEPAPKIVFDEIGSRQAATAEAIRSLIDAGVITPDEVLEGAVRQQFGLPPKDPNADPVPVEPTEEPVEASGAGPKAVTAHLPGKHPQDSHGNDHGVDVIPGDKLKGAGRIDLALGERLLRSDRLRGEGGRAWLAVTEKDGKRSLRLGLGNANFGTRHDHGGPWRAGPDRTAEIDAERAELRADIEELEDELESAEADPETDPRSLEERRAQLEDLYGAESGVGELPGGSTAMLDEGGARQLRETLAKALEDGKKVQADLDEPYQELDRLTNERDRLKLRARGRKFTDEEDAEWDRLTAAISRAQAELDPTSGPERPESGYWTFAEGSIPGQWADVHYDIYLDDPSVGVEVKLGAVPHGSDMDFDDMRGAEMTASFDMAEANQLVRLLAKMESGDRSRSSSTRDVKANSGRRVRAHRPARRKPVKRVTAHTPGGHQHNQQSHGNDHGVDVIPGDKLKLAGRIPLADGESLVGSDVFVTRASGVVPMALTRTSVGPRLRIGTGILDEDKKRWAGRNLGSTVNLDENGMRQFRAALDEMRVKGDEGGRRFRAIEDREVELDQQRRDIIKRQFAKLSRADRKRLDQIDRRIEQIDNGIASEQAALRNSRQWLEENNPESGARWDAIDAEIAGLDPDDDADSRRIERLQLEQAYLVPSIPLRRMQAITRMREERENLDLERQQLTANPTPLSPDDRAELAAVESDIAANDAQLAAMSEASLVDGVIPGEWADLVYQVDTRDTTSDSDTFGVSYLIAVRPKDADADWYPGEDNTATDLEPKELAKLAKMLDDLTGDKPKSSSTRDLQANSRGRVQSHRPGRHRRPVRRKRVTAHTPGGHQHNQQSHAGGPDISGPLLGAKAFTTEQYERAYGDVVDERSLGVDEDGMALTVRFFELGDAHLVVDLPGGHQVVGEFDGAEGMRALAEGIRTVQHEKLPDSAPTGDVVADHNSREHPFYVAKDDYGDIRLRDDDAGEDDYLEFGQDEAWELFDALNDLADSYDAELNPEEDEDGEVEAAAGSWVQAHLPGLHPQDRHGRRFKVRGDPSSGLRKSQRELREAARQAEAAQELDDLRLSLAKARQRSDAFAKAAAEGSTPEGKPTSTPTRMTSGQYTKILKDEHVRLQLLDGKTEKEAKATARPKATIDELKARNTELRKALRAKGVDHRTEEQRRADDVEKNTLLDEVEQLATAGGHDGAAKRAAAAKMSRTELRKFVADVKDYQRRQKAKKDAGGGDAFQAAEAASRAAPRQVGYIKGLLRQLAKSGGSVSGPTETAEIRKMSKRDASAYIKRLEGATT